MPSPFRSQPALTRRAVIAGGTLAAVGWAGGCSTPRAGRPRAELLSSPPRPHTVLVALDLQDSGRRPVAGALRRLAERAESAAAGVEVAVALGASVFDRAGLAARRPRQLAVMPAFSGDVLDPRRCHGDVLVQMGADTVEEADREAGAIVDDLPVRWRMSGFREGARIDAGRPVATNLFGFVEGHGNPEPASGADLVRVDDRHGDPAWAVGGSYLVIRVIQFATELWNRDPVAEQERIIGRRRDGSWPDGRPADAEPAYAADPHGRHTPLDSHVRRANPRDGAAPPMTRRGYSFRGRDSAGRDEEGLLFTAYQSDLAAGFEAVQRRLAGERLGRYTLTVGGGYFFVPPRAGTTRWVDPLLDL
ncbi:Dyp-type peroxidase [Actinoplanes sp. NPDC049118]|uniref:Dyp-type peroxidase n=1 Tax=Actinoplanes sp. NPDC049118 TaxID=3155769 RepID=UPI003409389E